MSDSDAHPVIWVSSSEEPSSEYATCAEDSIDLEISDRDDITPLIIALTLAENQAADEAGTFHEAPHGRGLMAIQERKRAAADTTSYRIGSQRGGTGTAHWYVRRFGITLRADKR